LANIKPKCVSIRLNRSKIIKIGIIKTIVGNIIDPNNAINRRLSPGKRSLLKLYAAKLPTNKEIKVAPNATINEFKKYFPKLYSLKIATNAEKVNSLGMNVGGYAITSTSFLKELEIVQMKGKIEKIVTTIKRK
jgi:hypothetical protein